MGKIFMIVIGIGLILFLALVVGPCVYYNFLEPDVEGHNVPVQENATHSFYIENTGGLIFTSDFEEHGKVGGPSIYILHGFWEFRGNGFTYIDKDIVLDEAIFGEITVKERRVK